MTIRIGINGEGIESIRRATDEIEVDARASEEVLHKIKCRVVHVKTTEEWMRYRLPMLARNLRRNLPVMDPALTTPMRRLWGKTAIIVGAGASLNGQAEELAALQDRGDLAIYVTNSASRMVRGHVRVCMESLPAIIADDHDVPLAVDATVDHSIFTRPEVDYVFFKAEGSYSGMAKRYAVRPLAFGTSVSTAAVAMAAVHGARRIVLIGHDLAYDADTTDTYNSGSRLAGMKFEIDRERSVGRYVNVPPGIHRPEIDVEQLGESSLWTTPDFVGVAQWLEGFAKAHPEIECVNATARGMHLEGWTPCYLRDAVIDAPQLPDAPVPPPITPDEPSTDDLAALRRWEMLRPEVMLYTQIKKMDAKIEGYAADVVRESVDMYREAASVIDGP